MSEEEERYQEEEGMNEGNEGNGLNYGEEEEEGGAFIDTSAARSSDNPPPPPPKEKKRRDGFYIIVIIMMLLAGGFLGWKLSEKNDIINQCQNERDELLVELDDLNNMMYEQGLDVGEDVKHNLENMLVMYDQMKVDNADMNDSITAQKDKIQQLMVELEDAKGDKSRYASKVRKLEKETQVLRSIMKDYIRTIDSLNVANGILTESLDKTLKDLEKTQDNLNTVSQERDQAIEKVNAGSKLVATGFTTTGIKERSSGSFKETTRANASTHIRSCFTVNDNAIANAGNKVLYMRIISPSGTVLNSSPNNTFTTEGGQNLIYSDKKTINYQNQSTDVCVFYELVTDADKGNYIAEIWADGVKIGQDNFVLK
ncbi:hypothetical protein K6119_08875 [Paracrocinitomix mangrovi]|uniref:hypothetical protein n=1 Tax=Paracrocinitomix mangrovi TaxID=2862509 RepID=UPI001C8E96C8|nr:hypothetical protein [Paracrocinitomix mangrovi]UKN03624.1 hypothetical protein K6119_08875 [Paracrocinitomix mangrovi]